MNDGTYVLTPNRRISSIKSERVTFARTYYPSPIKSNQVTNSSELIRTYTSSLSTINSIIIIVGVDRNMKYHMQLSATGKKKQTLPVRLIYTWYVNTICSTIREREHDNRIICIRSSWKSTSTSCKTDINTSAPTFFAVVAFTQT